jgi:ribonuclease P protein component
MSGPRTFGRERRLLSKRDFDRVFDAGRRAFARGLVVYVDESPAKQPRLGLVTGRRLGNAVARNRARRLLREAFRASLAELPPLDLVALPQPGAFPDELGAVRIALVEAAARAARSTPRPQRSPRKPATP